MLGPAAVARVAAELLASDVFCLPPSPRDSRSRSWKRWRWVSRCVDGGRHHRARHDGRVGWCTPPGRADLIAGALELAITEGETRDRVIAEARRRVEDAHDTVERASDAQAAPRHQTGQRRLARSAHCTGPVGAKRLCTGLRIAQPSEQTLLREASGPRRLRTGLRMAQPSEQTLLREASGPRRLRTRLRMAQLGAQRPGAG